MDYIARNGGGGTGGGDVTGVKGSAESTYRKGNVNITPENIGLGNVNNTSDAQKPVSTAQQTALDGKVDKVAGKGLSTNDYDNTAKGIVDGVTTALAGKANSSDLGDKSNLTTTDKSSAVAGINEVNWKAGTFGTYTISNATDIRDFIKKLITQADADLASKPAYMLFNIFAVYSDVDVFYGTIERQDIHGYSFVLNSASGNVAYRGYCDMSTNYLNVYRYTSMPIGQATLGTGFIAAFHDGNSYRCFVPFPFWASDANYTVALNGVSQVNVGNVLASASVETKYRTGFVLIVSGTYDYSKCGIAVNYTVTLN